MVLKLRQGQVWQQGDTFIRIVELHRLEVRYKICPDLTTGEGQHHHTSKKEFCRLLKGAALLTHEEVREIWLESPVREVE